MVVYMSVALIKYKKSKLFSAIAYTHCCMQLTPFSLSPSVIVNVVVAPAFSASSEVF